MPDRSVSRKRPASSPGPRARLAQAGLALLVLAGSGCALPGSSRSTLPALPAPTRTPVRLPDTWTPLPPSPTQQATSTAEPSETPQPSTSPTPDLTLSAAPGGDFSGSLTPTPDYLVPPYPDCQYTASSPGVRLLLAPFPDPYRVLPTMEPGRPYPAVIDYPTYSLLLGENGQPAGWVDYRLVALDFQGADCLSRRDQRQLTEFPRLCFFSPKFPIKAYADSQLSEDTLDLNPGNQYILLLQYQQAYFSSFGHAGPSFYVSRDEVTLSGDCQEIPTAGILLQDTTLYAQPDSKDENVVSALLAGQKVSIQSQTRSGSPPPGGSPDGEWVLIRISTSAGGLDGWCWSEFLDYR